MSIKEMKEDLYKWRGKPCSWIGKLNIVKILFLPKMIRFMQFLSKYQKAFIDTHKLILTFIFEGTSPRIT